MAQHEWARGAYGGYICTNCALAMDFPDMLSDCDKVSAPATDIAHGKFGGGPELAPVTNIASARVQKAKYANAITPLNCLRAAVAELEAGLPCTSLIIVIGHATPDHAATTLRIAGGASYYERVGLLESAKEVLVRDAALPTENK